MVRVSAGRGADCGACNNDAAISRECAERQIIRHAWAHWQVEKSELPWPRCAIRCRRFYIQRRIAEPRRYRISVLVDRGNLQFDSRCGIQTNSHACDATYGSLWAGSSCKNMEDNCNQSAGVSMASIGGMWMSVVACTHGCQTIIAQGLPLQRRENTATDDRPSCIVMARQASVQGPAR